MKPDNDRILLARNRTKRQHKTYLYEAQQNILRAMASKCIKKESVSEMVFTIVSCFLEQVGKDVSYLSERDRLKMQELRRAITGKK